MLVSGLASFRMTRETGISVLLDPRSLDSSLAGEGRDG